MLFRNYFPDGLWAYSLTSLILIIWNRKLQLLWLSIISVLFIGFELFQMHKLIKGTGDFNDIFIYFAFAILAIILNSFIKQSYTQPNEQNN